MKMFAGRTLVIATKHGKERVLAPLLEHHLGVRCIVPDDFDTDQFGTFSGEVERDRDPLSTARKKNQWAMQLTGCDLALASEGSFGPHPVVYFAPGNEELLVFSDRKNDLEIYTRELSTETNFSALSVTTLRELNAFAQKVGFPEHGLILRKSPDDLSYINKGITDQQELENYFNEFKERFGKAYVETDMRAMHNPSRIAVIEQAGRKLLEVISSQCPECSCPGFGLVSVQSGLACSLCGNPTESTLLHIHACKKCGYAEKRERPDHKVAEDPMFCNYCNP